MSRRECGAKKRDGTPCRAAPVAGRNRCRLHGGATPRGGAIGPAFKHGRYSRDLPTRLAARYREIQADQELRSLRAEIALVATRIVDVLGQIETGRGEAADQAAWAQIYHLIDRRRRLVESETRQLAGC